MDKVLADEFVSSLLADMKRSLPPDESRPCPACGARGKYRPIGLLPYGCVYRCVFCLSKWQVEEVLFDDMPLRVEGKIVCVSFSMLPDSEYLD